MNYIEHLILSLFNNNEPVNKNGPNESICIYIEDERHILFLQSIKSRMQILHGRVFHLIKDLI